MKNIGIGIVCCIAFILLIFAVNEFEIFGIKFWGVRKADVQRQVFEQSQSYIEGKRQELIKYHHEWIKSDSTSKLAIESTIRMNFANFNEAYIQEPELYNFLKNIKNK